VISTWVGTGATFAIVARSSAMAALPPISEVSRPSCRRSAKFSDRRRLRSMALSISCTTRSIGSALSMKP
jgi:hypothetical protein